jgi:transcriptional regulator with GAF, ATPase, and Fis domain
MLKRGEMATGFSFAGLIEFFQRTPGSTPGDADYNASFCRLLADATSADAASIWQIDQEHCLRLLFSTDIPNEDLRRISLRLGEGISGAVALSRQPYFGVNAQRERGHDQQVDDLTGRPTHSMISAPILFHNQLFGVINVVSHRPGHVFVPEWKDAISALGVMYGAAVAGSGKLSPQQYARMGEDERAFRGHEWKTTVVGTSPAVQRALYLCLKAGQTDIPVLVRGETGTGKELAARRIHEASPRGRGPFLEINCAALSETLLESELFGHVRGAFTGAVRDRQGKFAAASGGTLFLDEIGEMTPTSQAKILRSLEEKKITPLGSDKGISVDTRIIAATNKDIAQMIQKSLFREDLYYRLCGIEIVMPPLRERMEDIHLLALYFLNRIRRHREGGESQAEPPRLSSDALAVLRAFHWPGNVRQLEQALVAAATLCEGPEIMPEHFPEWLQKALDSAQDRTSLHLPPSEVEIAQGRGDKIFETEKKRYLVALNYTKYPGTGRWNISAASKRLGIARETLIYRLKRIGMLH